jgi:hypothetical protein
MNEQKNLFKNFTFFVSVGTISAILLAIGSYLLLGALL